MAVDPAYIREGLIKRGLPAYAADAFVLNMRDESELNPGINERKPKVPGSRGGYGLNQWTGIRRRQYEKFARSRGAPLDDVDTQLDFTIAELHGPEKRAFKRIMAARDAPTAAAMIVRDYLRPDEQHRERRAAKYLRGGKRDVTFGSEVQLPKTGPVPQWRPSDLERRMVGDVDPVDQVFDTRFPDLARDYLPGSPRYPDIMRENLGHHLNNADPRVADTPSGRSPGNVDHVFDRRFGNPGPIFGPSQPSQPSIDRVFETRFPDAAMDYVPGTPRYSERLREDIGHLLNQRGAPATQSSPTFDQREMEDLFRQPPPEPASDPWEGLRDGPTLQNMQQNYHRGAGDQARDPQYVTRLIGTIQAAQRRGEIARDQAMQMLRTIMPGGMR